MMWLWIPAVVLVALFILVLCWLFFKDYTCCPCRRRNRSPEPVLPTHHTSSFPHDLYPPSAPIQYPITPGGSPHLQLAHADLSARDQESVLPTNCDAKLFSISASLPPTCMPSKPSLTSSSLHSRVPEPSHDQELTPHFTSGLPSELVLRPEPQITPQTSSKWPSASESSSSFKAKSSFPSLPLSQDESQILKHLAELKKQEEKAPHKRTTKPEAQDISESSLKENEKPRPTADVSLSPVHRPKKPRPHAVSRSASRYYPRTARGTLHLHLRYAKNLSLRKVFRFENGDIPTLDLHHMTVKEATELAIGFIEDCMDENPRKFRIITGRGLHSRNGVSRLKPRIIQILDNYDLEYTEIYSGGCLQVSLD
ncbi:uncharacterized protein [Palaemon carinicauda]|uniref:uncharacterized protein isoform X2 n=1 Tax=Palaemon carinicauda TaxID=392227 RepID=UPI0035B669A6